MYPFLLFMGILNVLIGFGRMITRGIDGGTLGLWALGGVVIAYSTTMMSRKEQEAKDRPFRERERRLEHRERELKLLEREKELEAREAQLKRRFEGLEGDSSPTDQG